jgi:CBS domain-containing protein
MEPSQTEIESLIIELAEKSFKTFCGDISGMFGMDMACNPKEVTYEKVDGLRTRFENFAVVFSVKSESAKGGLDGTFQMVFNREGLFILAGVVAMQPGQMILEDINSGSLEKAEKVSNVLNEVGAALAGSWDRVFRKGLDGHGRLILANTFIGNPWDKAEEKIGLNNDEELVLVPYDMTIGPYPAFKCCAIFPKTVFAGTFESGAEQPAPAEETAREDTEETSQVETEETAREDTEGTAESEGSAAGDQAQPEAEETVAADESAVKQEPEAELQEETEGTAESEGSAAGDQAQPEAGETVAADESASEKEPEAAAEQKDDDGEEEPTVTVETEEKQERPISDAIKKLTRSSVVSSDESAPSAMAEKPALGSKEAFLDVCAKDIMQKEVVWGKPDDSVQQALSKIQQHNTEYIMIGKEQVPEGIISKSDLAGALSPYLRNIFAKWRRPLDDATLQIKIKWIMSKPTCTISPETSLAKIMENMCQMDKKCLPVVDEQGKVRGLVTVFDILRAFLKDSLPK